ncbi:hypothetical protein P4G83_28740 [Bacillus cereus]|nr:hypothetical protein [Bacillus cereus]
MKPNSIVPIRREKANDTKRRHSAIPWRIVSADGYDVLQFCGQFDPKHAPRNADLIVAAPYLLESCQLALSFLEGAKDATGEEIATKLREAIAEATGQSNRTLLSGGVRA